MELRLLNYFLEIARERNISRAANHLHISQPTLSKQIQEFEHSIGKKLFIRGNRGIKLTKEGELLKKRAEEILDLVSRTENELKSDDISGELYIGAIETQYVRVLTDIFSKLAIENPNIKFNIFSGNNEDILDKLSKGLIDFGFILSAENENLQDYIILEFPLEEEWGILVKKDHPLTQKETVMPQDLIHEKLIISHELEKSNKLQNLLGLVLEELQIIGSYTLLFNASIMVESGLGIAIAWDKIVNTDNSDLIFIPLEKVQAEKLSIVYKRNTQFSKLASRFLEELDK